MKKLTLLIIVLLTMQGYGQTSKSKRRNKISKNEYETYWVIYNKRDVKIGEYKYYKDKVLRTRGYYDNNIKDSIWTYYSFNGKKIKSGRYKNDQKHGVWEEYTYPFGFTPYKYKVSKGKYKENKKDSLWITYEYYPENVYNKKLIREKGYYKNGLKENLYVYYDIDGTSPLAVGKYKNDSMINKWSFYIKGKLLQIYNFDNYTITYSDTLAIIKNRIITEGKYKDLIFVEKDLTYKNGLNQFYSFFYKNINIPIDSKENSGWEISASFQINEDGTISKIVILKSSGVNINKEFIRILNLTIGNWNPAIFNNNKVPCITVVKLVSRRHLPHRSQLPPNAPIPIYE